MSYSGTIPASDAMRLIKAAQDKGMPPYAMLVFTALLRYSNTRWQSRAGIRKLALCAGINKDTATRFAGWLCDNGIVERTQSSAKSPFSYRIQPVGKWLLSVRSGRTDKKPHLSDTTAQLSVRSGRTDKKAELHRKCPAASDKGRGECAPNVERQTQGALSRYTFKPVANNGAGAEHGGFVPEQLPLID